jgi:hypothetical protein
VEINPLAQYGLSRKEGLLPIIEMMRGLTVFRYAVALALACAALAGCGSDDASTEASKPIKTTSDSPGYSDHPELPPMSSLTPTERSNLTAGTEAKANEFKEVSNVVHGYLDARAEGDWELACSFVSPSGQRMLQASGEKVGSGDTSCPAVLPQETTGTPEELQKEASFADVGSVRIARYGGGAFGSAFATYSVGDALRVMILSGGAGELGVTAPDPVKIG